MRVGMQLASDVDASVKSGADTLNRLVKVQLARPPACPATPSSACAGLRQDLVTEHGNVDVHGFISLLKDRIHVKDPFTRQARDPARAQRGCGAESRCPGAVSGVLDHHAALRPGAGPHHFPSPVSGWPLRHPERPGRGWLARGVLRSPPPPPTAIPRGRSCGGRARRRWPSFCKT